MINFSELLWKPRLRSERRSESVDSPALVNGPDLQELPVDNVELDPKARVVIASDPQSPGADRFRYVRMRLRELRGITNVQSVLITSAQPQEGKSTAALNLAAALAEGGKRPVLLLEADLHKPSLGKYLGLQVRPGLSESIEAGNNPLRLVRKLEPLGLYYLQAGTAQGNPTDLLQTERFSDVMRSVRSHFDWIVVDSAPVNLVADAICLAQHVDTVLLVVRAGRTSKAAVSHACKTLGPKNVLGVLFNGASENKKLYGKYGNSYYGKK